MKTKSILPVSSLLLLLPATASAALFTGGHADVFAIGYEEGELEPHVHAENAVIDGNNVEDAEFEPGEITTVVPQSTFDFLAGLPSPGRPAGSEWDPVGVAPGVSFWFLPQSNSGEGGASTLGAPFAGVGTEELAVSDWSSPITIALTSVTGPGDFSMYSVSPFGEPTFVMSSANGIDGSDVISQAAGGHEHYNWAFTAPGVYDVEVSVSGTHVTNGFEQASATYQFEVVPEPSAALLGLLSTGLMLRRRR